MKATWYLKAFAASAVIVAAISYYYNNSTTLDVTWDPSECSNEEPIRVVVNNYFFIPISYIRVDLVAFEKGRSTAYDTPGMASDTIIKPLSFAVFCTELRGHIDILQDNIDPSDMLWTGKLLNVDFGSPY